MAAADLIAFYLPMHTATRLAMPVIDRVRGLNPAAVMCAYGLYAPLNADLLRQHGIAVVLGPEAEQELVDLASAGPQALKPSSPHALVIPRLAFIQPDRVGLPALDRYASLQMPDGSILISDDKGNRLIRVSYAR